MDGFPICSARRSPSIPSTASATWRSSEHARCKRLPPEVSGKYHRKRVFPTFSTVEVAPAANGKGCINDMRHLADLYEELIKTETGQAEAEYLQALEEWEQKKAEAHQKHRSVVVKDAPKPAAKAYLNIPTQVTKAKMLVHLRDNGNIGADG